MPWREFESLVGAFYRHQGYTVFENIDDNGPDGGIDLVLKKDGQRTIVQCKRLWSKKVTVQQVREFFGVVVAEGAERGLFVTTSEFTPDAMEFGLRQASLELIPGMRLVQMLQDAGIVSPSPAPATLPAQEIPSCASGVTVEDEQAPACPRCSEKMIIRRSRKGRTAGSEFWGCQRFPSCRGTRQLRTPNVELAE